MDNEFTTEPMLPKDPEIILATGQFNTNVEVIIGTNSGEGIPLAIKYLLNPSYWDDFRETFDSVGMKKLFQLTREPTPEEVRKAHQILNFYIGSIENLNSDVTEEHIQGKEFIFHCELIFKSAYQ